MKICQAHWRQLKDAIELRGLLPFVAKDGLTATEQVAADLAGTSDKERPYDPLMRANFAIWTNGLKCGGLYMMNGDFCPLCELESTTKLKAEDWISPCCDAIAEDFVQKGWLSAPV